MPGVPCWSDCLSLNVLFRPQAYTSCVQKKKMTGISVRKVMETNPVGRENMMMWEQEGRISGMTSLRRKERNGIRSISGEVGHPPWLQRLQRQFILTSRRKTSVLGPKWN